VVEIFKLEAEQLKKVLERKLFIREIFFSKGDDDNLYYLYVLKKNAKNIFARITELYILCTLKAKLR